MDGGGGMGICICACMCGVGMCGGNAGGLILGGGGAAWGVTAAAAGFWVVELAHKPSCHPDLGLKSGQIR